MEKHYPFYTVKELLGNESFIRWKLFPDEKDTFYWESVLVEHPEMKDRILQAERIVNSVEFKQKLLEQEKYQLLFSIRRQISQRKKEQKRRVLYRLAVACLLGVVISLSVIIRNHSFQPENLLVETPETVYDPTTIQLVLADNRTMVLEENADIQYSPEGKIIVNDGETQIISGGQPETVSMQKNKLIVPRGKRSSLTLEDGTKVWVNSGSTLEFPAVFDPYKREIHLEGEIYIEVAKREDHPFLVHTPDWSVEVLGTRFNVSAYKEDETQFVVLVEGSVEVEIGENKTILLPDQMLSVSSGKSRIDQVNTYDYICWRDGILQFTSTPLHQILTQLSRYYDMPIVYDEEIRDRICTGKLVLFDDIELILQVIDKIVPIEFELREDQITLTKRK